MVSLFRSRINPAKLEAESTKLATMGQSSLTIAIVRQFFANKRSPQSAEVSDVITHFTSGAHIVGFIKHKTALTEVAASKLTTIFHCLCQLTVETDWPGVMDISRLDGIVEELIRYGSDESPLGAPAKAAPKVDAVEVEQYNSVIREGASSHLFVRLRYVTGSGNQREILCCPQCGTDASCVHSATVHTGKIELMRETKSAASRTKVIARWSCCCAPIATTDTSVVGYKLEQDALRVCHSLDLGSTE